MRAVSIDGLFLEGGRDPRKGFILVKRGKKRQPSSLETERKTGLFLEGGYEVGEAKRPSSSNSGRKMRPGLRFPADVRRGEEPVSLGELADLLRQLLLFGRRT